MHPQHGGLPVGIAIPAVVQHVLTTSTDAAPCPVSASVRFWPFSRLVIVTVRGLDHLGRSRLLQPGPNPQQPAGDSPNGEHRNDDPERGGHGAIGRLPPAVWAIHTTEPVARRARRRSVPSNSPAPRSSSSPRLATGAPKTRRVYSASSDWTALTVAISSMSRLSHPRERSLSGAEMPCRIGPRAVAPPSRWAIL